VLRETQARIAAIANLHRSLYTAEDVRTVDLAAYLTALVDELRQSIAANQTAVLAVAAVNARTTTDKAVAIGMIVTELITNAVKYAYPDGGGEVRLRLERNPAGGLVLAVEDDGVGRISTEGRVAGLGGKIVGAMARSLSTDLESGARLKGGHSSLLTIEPRSFYRFASRLNREGAGSRIERAPRTHLTP
jgi:two-component sensor histidine kinase